jgi:uncharacterized alkaline shock family protein YloU
MTGHASISTDILARYAGDAAMEVEGVRSLVSSQLPRHKGVRIEEPDGRLRIELHVAVEWGVSIPEVGRRLQERVREYIAGMADVDVGEVAVVVDEIGRPDR